MAGSIALTIGTAVSGTAWLAALVTIPVAFAIFFAGVAGPNAASGVTAALLAYVLPVASPGTAATIPARLAGWWLARGQHGGRPAAVAAESRGTGCAPRRGPAAALGRSWRRPCAARRRPPTWRRPSRPSTQLMDTFAATPYRPTGLATADQALASVVQLLEWCTALIATRWTATWTWAGPRS